MNPITITADRLWDGTGAATLVRPRLRVLDGAVESVQRGLLPPPTCGGDVIDFPGCTILPGLIDTHVHLVFSAQATNAAIIAQVTGESDTQLTHRALGNAAAALHAGITTVRDCGGKGRIVQDVRDRIRRGDAPGPDILSCGMPITTRRGHCHWLGLTADTLSEVQAVAERMLAEDADFLKVMATGGNMTPSSDPMQAQYDLPALLLIADTGRRVGIHAAAHVLSRAGFPGAVAANFRTIEHCDMRVEEWRYEFDADLARRMVQQEQYAGLTMSGTARRAFVPEIRQVNDGPVQRLDKRFECERRLLDSGVRFTLHSDAGVRLTPIDRLDLGLRAAVIELKLTPAEALQAVTRTAAQAIDLDDRGTLEAGKRADLVVVEGNPLQDLECLGRVRAVMKAGVWMRGAGIS
jgi:imidazolonepropionase-like amidohydrolase